MKSLKSFAGFPREQIERSIVERFETIAQHYADRVALTDRGQCWTYDELNRAANRIAHAILKRRDVSDETIPLLLPQSAAAVISALGVIKARKAYCALAPSHPGPRLNHILQELRSELVVTNAENAALARKLGSGSDIVFVDKLDDGLPDENPHIAFAPSLAAIFYTSGSTGQPKGVQHTECTIQHRVWLETDASHICPRDRISSLFSLSFSASTADTFGALLNGACLCMYDIRNEGLDAMADWLLREQLTFFHIPVAAGRQFLDLLDPAIRFPAVRHLVPAGAIFRPDLERFWNHFPNGVLVSHLGSAETGMIARMEVAAATRFTGDVVPLGYPVKDKEILILGDSGTTVPVGQVGEIAIRSRYLASGYAQRAELTVKAFIPDPAGGDMRIYRMGDLGRISPEGYVEYLGRRDAQIKVRGYTVHISEVEAALHRQELVKEAAVLAMRDQSAEKRLAAYIVLRPGAAASVESLRSSLRGNLPEYMIPSSFIVVKELPRTANGKLDTLKLPAPGRERPALNTPFVATRSELETELAKLWATVLDLESVGVHDTFLELGGHSLAAIQIASRILRRHGINLSPRLLLESCTISSLAATIQKELRLSRSRIPCRRTSGPCELSFAQQRLWFLAQLQPDSAIYNVPRAVRIKGAVNVAALRDALNAVVGRHEALRSTFEMSGDRPVQTVREDWVLELPTVDLRHLSPADRDRTVEDLANQEARRPFSLATDLMIRAVLVWIEQEEYVLLLTMHHIASDASSREILFAEIEAFYAEFISGKPSGLDSLPIQYADYAVWQREQINDDVLATQLSYWKNQLDGLVPALPLPFDRPRQSRQTHCGAKHSFPLSRSLSEAVKAFSRNQGATLFMTLLAAFQTLLHRYSAGNDIAVGSPITGRTRIETEGLIGFFVNTLVLRTNFSGDPSFIEVLQRVRRTALEAYAHQNLPFEKIVEELRPDRDTPNPIFQVSFVMQTSSRQELTLADLEVTPIAIDTGTSKFDLTLIVRDMANPERELEAFLEYDTDLFNVDTIVRLAGHFETLLAGLIADPSRQVSMVPLLTSAERRQLIEDWNHTQASYPISACVHHLFEAQVRRTPANVAVVSGERQLTYAELNRRSNLLAHRLRNLGIGTNKIAAVYVEPSPEMLIAFLGILKAGGGYLPLDLSSPQERIQLVLNDAQPLVLLTTQNAGRTLPNDLRGRIVYLDRDWPAVHLESQERPDVHPDEEDVAYVLYTSGSSGTPKGVVIPHGAFSNHMQWMMSEFPLNTDDRVMQRTRCAFDASVWEFYAPLLAGARLVIAPSSDSADPSALITTIRTHEVTVLQVVPSLLGALLKEERFGSCRSLRQVFCGGEALPVELRDHFMTALHCKLTNLYGPTETCIDSTFSNCERSRHQRDPVDAQNGVVSIGRPIANTQVYVLDGSFQPVPIGVAGELYIAGAGLATGYLNRPELTAERFLPNPFSSDPGSRIYRTGDIVRYDAGGNLHFMGRADHQIKMRGFRIELQEIESVLRGHPQVKDAIVTMREDKPGNQRLVAYITQRNKEHCTVGELRLFLGRRLPEYMIPAAFVFLDVLPLASNGKVDRKSLPAPAAIALEAAVDGENEHVAPRTPMEHVLVWMWSEILSVTNIGVTDNFFELGGHSLLATRVTSRIRSILNIELPVRKIFEAPTVERLSRIILENEGAKPDIERVARLVIKIANASTEEKSGMAQSRNALNQTF